MGDASPAPVAVRASVPVWICATSDTSSSSSSPKSPAVIGARRSSAPSTPRHHQPTRSTLALPPALECPSPIKHSRKSTSGPDLQRAMTSRDVIAMSYCPGSSSSVPGTPVRAAALASPACDVALPRAPPTPPRPLAVGSGYSTVRSCAGRRLPVPPARTVVLPPPSAACQAEKERARLMRHRAKAAAEVLSTETAYVSQLSLIIKARTLANAFG
eukprot:m51a1_g10040 hypothetical protein (215) ;mRNA; r:19860-20576